MEEVDQCAIDDWCVRPGAAVWCAFDYDVLTEAERPGGAIPGVFDGKDVVCVPVENECWDVTGAYSGDVVAEVF